MSLSVKLIIQEQLELEEKKKQDVSHLSLDDRKHRYSQEQLQKFVEFKAEVTEKLGKEAVEGFEDNIFCRFLDGYLFNFAEGIKNISGYTVAARQAEMENRDATA